MSKVEFKFKELGKLGESISIQEMTGNDQVYVRITKLYKNKDGEWRPTDKGVSIPLEKVDELISILTGYQSTETKKKEFKGSELTSDLSEI